MKVELPEIHILKLLWYLYFYRYAMVSDLVWHLPIPSPSTSATVKKSIGKKESTLSRLFILFKVLEKKKKKNVKQIFTVPH